MQVGGQHLLSRPAAPMDILHGVGDKLKPQSDDALQVRDLMAALERSVTAAKAARQARTSGSKNRPALPDTSSDAWIEIRRQLAANGAAAREGGTQGTVRQFNAEHRSRALNRAVADRVLADPTFQTALREAVERAVASINDDYEKVVAKSALQVMLNDVRRIMDVGGTLSQERLSELRNLAVHGQELDWASLASYWRDIEKAPRPARRAPNRESA